MRTMADSPAWEFAVSLSSVATFAVGIYNLCIVRIVRVLGDEEVLTAEYVRALAWLLWESP